MADGAPSIRSLLARAESFLRDHGVPNARRNAEWLLADTLSCGTLDLYIRGQSPPERGEGDRFWRRVERRAQREPLQYILGSTEFMSLAFETPPGVFVPRPDTEVLVEVSERRLRNVPIDRALQILDLCCGCGVIAVSLAARLANLEAVAVDVSPRAVATTRANAERNGVGERVRAVETEAIGFLAAVDPAQRFTAVVCNPPYIETSRLPDLPPEVRDHEPVAALDGGDGGLDFYRAAIGHLPRALVPGGWVAFEIGDDQGKSVSELLAAEGFTDISRVSDYAGRDRVVCAVAPRAEPSTPREGTS